MVNFKSNYLVRLEDPEIIQRFHLIFEPMFKKLVDSITHKLQDTIVSMAQSASLRKKESAEKDTKIKLLSSEVAKRKIAADDLEQQGRKDSVRIFGLPETGSSSVDDKVLALCNKRMKLWPHLELDEIAVAHRVGAIQDEEENDEPPPPRALLVKFASRRSKARVMAARSKLRPKSPHVISNSRKVNSPKVRKLLLMTLTRSKKVYCPKSTSQTTSPSSGQNWPTEPG